jgi:hypothetical protein
MRVYSCFSIKVVQEVYFGNTNVFFETYGTNFESFYPKKLGILLVTFSDFFAI